MVEPLNPALPVSTSPAEVSAEFRGIKGVLKDHDDWIDTADPVILKLATLSTLGAILVSKGTDSEMCDVLGFTEVGKQVREVPSFAALAAALGVINPIPQVTTALVTSGGTTSTIYGIILPGGIKINVLTVVVSGDGTTSLGWPAPYNTAVWGAVASPFSSTSQNSAEVKVENATVNGCTVDHSGSGNRTVTIIAIGM